MKITKLMIAAVLMGIAVSSQAAAVLWKTDSGYYVKQATTGTTYNNLSDATAYLFDAAVVTQSSLVDAFEAGTLDFTKLSSIDNSSVSAGKIAADSSATSYGTSGKSYDLYFAVLAKDTNGDDALFISSTASYAAQSVADTTIKYKTTSDSKKFYDINADNFAGYSAAGWYVATTDIPEPTSGLLFVIGGMLLGLRRRV